MGVVAAHALGERGERYLGHAVGGVAGAGAQAPAGGRVDDRPPAGPRHDRHRRARQPERRLDVDGKEEAEVVVARLGHVAAPHEARVVEQHVEPAQRREGCPRQAVRVGGVGQVARQPGIRLDAARVTVRDRHARPFRPQHPHDRGADPARRPGHQGRPAREACHPVSLTRRTRRERRSGSRRVGCRGRVPGAAGCGRLRSGCRSPGRSAPRCRAAPARRPPSAGATPWRRHGCRRRR